MHEAKLSKAYEIINDFVKSKIISDVEKFHNDTLSHIDLYVKHYNNWKSVISELEDRLDKFYATAKLHKEIEKVLHDEKDRMEQNFHFILYEELKNKIESSLNEFEHELILNQSDEHFSIRKDDTKEYQIIKKIKKIIFNSSSNVYRTFKGKEKQFYWKRKIPFKNLATHHILNNYLNEVLKQAEGYIELIGSSYNNLLNEQKEIDKIFTHQHIPFVKDEEIVEINQTYSAFDNKILKLKNDLEDGRNKFTEHLLIDLQNYFDLLNADFKITGTIELPKYKFRDKRINSGIKLQAKKAAKSKSNYKNFISALFDRKEYYEDLQWFTSLLVGDSFTVDKYGQSYLSESIEPTIKEITKNLNKSIDNLKTGSSDVIKTIDFEKESLRKSLDQKLIPSLIGIISSNNFEKVFSEYSEKLINNLNEFEKEYNFVKPKNLNYRLKEDQLKEFSPKEIISPIVIAKLNSSISDILDTFNGKTSKLSSTIISLGRIVEFNLDSAKIKYNDDSTSNEDAINIAIEGLIRAKNKAEEFYNEIKNNCEEIPNSLQSTIKFLLEDLISLSNIDRLLTIKLQVSKEKAIQDVKNNFQSALSKIIELAKWIKTKSISLFTASKEKLVGISSKVGLSSSQMELSEAMADYLVRVSDSMEKLPYVYQRLFSNEQISDERIFIGREEETAKLEKAIKYWCNKQIASVMLIGEKGSGTSSLINISLQKYDLCAEIYRSEFSGTIYTEADLLKILVKTLKISDVGNTEQLLQTIKEFKERRIVILENIEDYFLRVVDGFDALNKLLEIITSTNNQILWITTCNTFAWQYLKKVVNIHDYFVFNINLKELDENIVENIILSRHNISGYDLYFIPSPTIEKQKYFIKMNDKEKQELLKKNYFNDLSKLVSNNIAVALFLWLRSIVKSDEEMIQVSAELELDYSFLKKLSDKKLFTLMAIILHDGLSHEEHSLIFNMSLKSSQLLFATLSDDGIIFKRGDNYKINFQLYKPIISLLKDKNILH